MVHGQMVVLGLHGLIMTSGIPFGFISPVMDVIAILAGGVVIFLAWDAMRDLR